MLRRVLVVLGICAAELLMLFMLWPHYGTGQKTAGLNALVQSAERADGSYAFPEARSWGSIILLDADGTVLFANVPDYPTDPVIAAGAGFSVLPVQLSSGTGYLFVTSPEVTAARQISENYAAVSAAVIAVSAAVMLIYLSWFDYRFFRPLQNVRHVAEEIARGHLDVPLTMDRGGVFGAFTESFDLMRSELARAQAAEARATADKKELIAKLSHDLRTPVASIQAVSELGAFTSDGAAAQRFSQIYDKTLQMNLLVSNLLSAAVDEDTELSVTLRCIPSAEVVNLLRGADYQHWMDLQKIPECSIAADPVRLQQVFDNIFINAYKYGKAPVTVSGYLQDGDLLLELEDTGGGVPIDEASRLHLKYFRGSNAKNAPGAGLGLYICSELLAAMHGELLVRNGAAGVAVSVIIPLCRNRTSFRIS